MVTAFRSHPKTHSFDEHKITYDEIGIVERSESGNPVYGIQSFTVSYYEFIDVYMLLHGRNTYHIT